MITIKDLLDNTLFESEEDTLLDALQEAVRKKHRLRGANLQEANLRGANLQGAYLRGAYLRGVVVNWGSHALIGEILRRWAGNSIEERKFAGLVLISTDWCWKKFLAMKDDPCLEKALTGLAKWVQPGDNHPVVLDKYVVREDG